MLKDYENATIMVAGCDEAGRGCLAGPVFAAAVILPRGFSHGLLNDSKKMSEGNRLILRNIIMEQAVAWAVAMCDHQEIDQMNILNASILAMHRAVQKLKVSPGLLLVDGNRFKPFPGIEHQCVVGGDGIYKQIAAASVMAKTERDAYMDRLHREYPDYGWDKNKAYATSVHREALMKFGASPYHRKSFRLDYQLKLALK